MRASRNERSSLSLCERTRPGRAMASTRPAGTKAGGGGGGRPGNAPTRSPRAADAHMKVRSKNGRSCTLPSIHIY